MRKTLEATGLIILVDGVYARSPDGELTQVIVARAGLDPAARDLRVLLENATVEPPRIVDGLPLAQALAFYARLDANPRTALDWLLDQGVTLHDATEGGAQLDPGDPDVIERAIDGLRRIALAAPRSEIAVAGTASALLLGYPKEPDWSALRRDAILFWPLQSDAPMTLAPKPSNSAPWQPGEIGNHLLTGRPSWFSGLPEKGMTVACLPFDGCGYVAADAVRAVRPLWISFDRQSLAPRRIYLD